MLARRWRHQSSGTYKRSW